MTLLVEADAAAWAQRAAHLFRVAVLEAVKLKGRFAVAVSGGTSPDSMFRVLAQQRSTDVPWDKVHLFWVDERCVPPTDPGSNFGNADKILLSKVPIPRAQVNRIRGELSPSDAARTYHEELKRFFGSKISWPEFDFVILGLGEDGHTASLFPKSPALEERALWACTSLVEDQPVYKNRVTLTFPVVNHAAQVVFLCQGDRKANIVKRVLVDHDPALPATRVKPKNGKLTWLLDLGAAMLVSSFNDVQKGE